jgi:DNA-binding Lrp family transcriptional regulator
VKSTQRPPLDALDRVNQRILARLQEDGRLPIAQLARELHMSVTPCADRVRRLEREGYIFGYRAELAPDKLGQLLLAYVQIVLDRTTPDVFERFKAAMELLDTVQECHMVAGLRLSDQAARARHAGVSQRAEPRHCRDSRRAADPHVLRHGGGQRGEPHARVAGQLSLPPTLGDERAGRIPDGKFA